MMMLRSGRLIDPLNLDFSRITLHDLAWALDGAQRWGAHAFPRISVAQHTIACAREAYRTEGPRVALLALHHDDGEAFFGDMCRDLKSHPKMAWYREQEHEATRQCIAYFAPECADLPLDTIKKYDNGSLLVEWNSRFPVVRDYWQPPDVDPIHPTCFSVKDDWRAWIRMHYALKNDL